MKIILLVPVFLICALLMPLSARSQTAAEVLESMENVMRGESNYSEMTMTIVRPRFEREVSVRSWMMGRDHSLIIITAPARDRGTAFLMRQNNIWSYDPRIDRTTRMPSSMMSQSWMGSDFTNDDLVRDSDILDDYEHQILRTETYEGHLCYVIELIPKPESPIVWGKVLMWVTKDSYLQLRMEQYDQRGDMINEIKLDQIKNLDGREIPSRITVRPVDKSGHSTILEYKRMEFDIDISESFFTQDNMQRAGR
ncbi:MAG: outer membrane lipoprotein-sorting protein [Saprospirales bacterium]|nr:MAG: outer membrane lipoprotein-sorting protein [Saprospirales bacterium]